MRTTLKLLDSKADFICGFHFAASDFQSNGRLKPRAVPSFFPSHSNFIHDHPYHRKDSDASEAETSLPPEPEIEDDDSGKIIRISLTLG